MEKMVSQAINRMNRLGEKGDPFLFVFDFALKSPIVLPLKEIDASKLLYHLQGQTNEPPEKTVVSKGLKFKAIPVTKPVYCQAFNLVQRHIRHGDSFLLNLTMPAKVKTNFSLKEIYYAGSAKYKLWLLDNFTVFSPETFVQIHNGIIRSFPMKGTMDATLPDSEKKLLENKKELAEHYTIVDLIRNDLSMVADDVKVVRFRYIDRVKTHKGELLQMSSEIAGRLPQGYEKHLGEIMVKLLPAGSISGAPKKKTLEIIRKAEPYDRGYYTGVFGLFDGKNLDSGVMIRFVEQTSDGLVYKSGGGITANSQCENEYRELIDKIYVPLA